MNLTKEILALRVKLLWERLKLFIIHSLDGIKMHVELILTCELDG